MYEITTETRFSAAHRLKNYHGPCENLHGHNWTVRATVRCAVLDKSGIGMDFKTLRDALNSIVSRFDHQDLNSVLEHDGINPSSENIARLIFERLRDTLAGKGVSVGRVEVLETPENCAAYYE